MPEPFSARPFLGDSSRGVQTESSRPSKQLAFTVQEYRERVEKVQREMAAKHLDGLLLHSMPNICYMTGMQSLALDKYYLVVVPRSGDPVLVIQDFESYNAWLYAWVEEPATCAIEADYIQPTRRLLDRLGLADKKLGVEMGFLSGLNILDYLRLKEALPKAALVEATDLVTCVRAVKSPAESTYMREAARITSVGMKAAIEPAEEGRTDNDLAAAENDGRLGFSVRG